MGVDGAFGDLRKLADWFSTSPQRTSVQVERIARRLGATAVPLLGRELRHADPRRRDAARDALALLATTPARARVISELRTVTHETGTDEPKVCALGLLSELGEHAEARFADPSAMQRRSALALAAQLDTPADVANAADLMIKQLEIDDIGQMLELLVESAPEAAYRLAAELGVRLDLDAEQRARIAAIVAPLDQEPRATSGTTRRVQRAPQVAVLVETRQAVDDDDDDTDEAPPRIVVVASRKIAGERRYRRWAVLVDAGGRIADCLHEDDAAEDADAAPIIAALLADGYSLASSDVEHARNVVASAARVTANEPERLTSAYYLGRDLLELGDAHVSELRARIGRDPTALMLGRAVELLATGDHARAATLLERCDADHPDVAAARAACALATGHPAAAVEPLNRAIAAEPTWPLHHWNLAVALQQLGDTRGCYHALRRFVATSGAPSGLDADPDQPGRIAWAERMVAELERAARLAGTSLRRRKKSYVRRR